MYRSGWRFVLALTVASVVTGFAFTAAAHKLDLALAHFIDCDNDGNCSPGVARYERFMAEYTFGLSPKILAPAETLGYSGFYMGLEGTLTPIPDGGDTADDRWYDGTAPRTETPPGVMFMPAVHVRKGLPWSFEIGGTLNYLAMSELVGLGGDIKWSIFEGYREGFRGAIPDLAIRGSVLRVIGQSDVDLTIVGLDGSLSYPFGIGGMIVLTPYTGFQYLWSIVRIEPLIYRENDGETFHLQNGDQWDTSGLTSPNLGRSKLFWGLRFQYELLSATFELGWGLKKSWDTDVANEGQVGADQLQAEVDHQIQFSAGVGMDF